MQFSFYRYSRGGVARGTSHRPRREARCSCAVATVSQPAQPTYSPRKARPPSKAERDSRTIPGTPCQPASAGFREPCNPPRRGEEADDACERRAASLALVGCALTAALVAPPPHQDRPTARWVASRGRHGSWDAGPKGARHATRGQDPRPLAKAGGPGDWDSPEDRSRPRNRCGPGAAVRYARSAPR